jgi:hypothetical protein
MSLEGKETWGIKSSNFLLAFIHLHKNNDCPFLGINFLLTNRITDVEFMKASLWQGDERPTKFLLSMAAFL